jgi:hypothetical protein
MDPINKRIGVRAAEAAAEERIEPPAPDPPLASPLALVVGQQFDTFQDFKAALSKWAVSQRFGFRFEKSDRLRNVVRCRDSKDCEFNVRAMWKQNLEKVSDIGTSSGLTVYR